MSRSRVFEEYVKIAIESGLIKNAADEGHLKVDMGSKEYSSREDLGSKKKSPKELSAAELLYGVQPNGKQKHIMEEAHPEPVVIGPSYDKINGLVENNIERQNIIINQVGRENTGIINHKKLAEQELVYELVRIANDLDIRGEDELRALADDCIEKIAEKSVPLNKKAWILPVAIISALAIGALYAGQHAPYVNDGLINNIDRAIEKAENIKDDNHWYTSLVKPQLKALMDSTIQRLNMIKSSWAEVEKNMMSNIGTVLSDEQILALEHSPQGQKQAAAYQKFIYSLSKTLPELTKLVEELDSESFKESMTVDHSPAYSFLGDTSKWIGKLMHGGSGLFLDKYDQLRKAVEAVLESIKEENKRARSNLSLASKRHEAAKAEQQRKSLESENKTFQESNKEALQNKPMFGSNPSVQVKKQDSSSPDKDEESIISLPNT